MTTPTHIPISNPSFNGNELAYVTECVQSSWISSTGRFIGAFEQGFADFVSAQHCVATNNGTTAIHLALAALGIGPGDEVIVPSLTYIATANAVRYCGATPVLGDVDEDTYNMDAEAVRAKLTERTRAVIPVHLYGHPADMDAINEVAATVNAYVVEDAAEAHGARYKGRPVGSLGTCATFSFYGNKIITTGEGGCVTTSDPELTGRLRLYRGQGMDPDRRYWFPIVGFNYRMTNVAAALGLAQLEQIDDFLAARRRLFDAYQERLSGEDLLVLPRVQPWAEPVNWIYTVRLRDTSIDRDDVMLALAAEGIETRPVFYPLHVMPPYREADGTYPVSELLGATGISLPTHLGLTSADVDRVCERLIAAVHAPGSRTR
jgi:perosamine synthetase